jgi:hypothetical protein
LGDGIRDLPDEELKEVVMIGGKSQRIKRGRFFSTQLPDSVVNDKQVKRPSMDLVRIKCPWHLFKGLDIVQIM